MLKLENHSTQNVAPDTIIGKLYENQISKLALCTVAHVMQPCCDNIM